MADENTGEQPVISAEIELGADRVERELARLRSEYPKLVLQIVSMRKLPSPWVVKMIAAQTTRASRTSCMLADKPEVDLLLRLSGTGQITEAIRKIGYRANGKKMLVATGAAKELKRLELELRKSPSYHLRSSDRKDAPSEEARLLVETAALLATRL
jgi:tRNA threonylcarbamoyladenosine modification (KEOPS) complex Cgi121 subunit